MRLPPYALFPELATAGTLLREITAADLADVLDISYYDARPATSLVEAATMLQQINEEYTRGECIHWGIADPRTARLVGTLGFYRGFADSIDELGCVLKPAFRGRGLMQPAMALAIGFGLRQMGLQNVVALTDAQNTPAIRLLERLQFRPAIRSEGSSIRYSLR